MLGWSVLEGIGAALVLPALVALVAGNYRGESRAIAYGVLGGVAGAGIAVGPILGGWATTELSWRVVFVGEVVVAIAILLGTPADRASPSARAPRRASTGSARVLSALGLALVVLGVLQASNWGWLRPRNSPVEPFGFSLTPFVVAAGALVLAVFAAWERRREQRGARAARPLPPVRDRHAARRPRDAARPEPDPDGDLLHDPALPAGRPGARRARDRRADAARLGRPVRRRARRLGARQALRAAAARPRRARDRRSSPTLLLLGTIEPELDNAVVPDRDGRARGRDGADRLPARQRRPVGGRGRATAARPAACRTPRSSSAPRSARRCSARS